MSVEMKGMKRRGRRYYETKRPELRGTQKIRPIFCGKLHFRDMNVIPAKE
jgi:hypothetical protein